MKKILCLILVSAFSLAVFAGCGTTNSETKDSVTATVTATESKTSVATETTKEPVKIVFATNETPLLTKDFWKIVSDKYMAANPNVTIENIAQPSSNVIMRDYLKTLLATGQFPDVMVMAAPMDFIPSGSLLEIPDQDVSYLADLDSGKFQGKRFVVPYKIQLNGIFYNKKIFADNGLSLPTNFQELLDIGKKLKANGIIPAAIGIKDGWPTLIVGSGFASAFLLTDYPNWGIDRNEGKVKYTNPEFKNAISKYATFVKELGNDDLTSVSYAQLTEMFFKGKAAMLPMGSWIQGEEAKLKPGFEVGFFPVPNDKSADTIAVYANEGLSISSSSKNSDVCKDFIKFFLTDKEWYGQFLKTEMLFPVTKEDVPYEMSNLRKEIGESFKTWKKVSDYDSLSGDAAHLPGVATQWQKMTANIASAVKGNKDIIDQELASYEKVWEQAKKASEIK